MKTLLHFILLVLILLFPRLSIAQLGKTLLTTAHSVGMANANVSLEGIDALYSNPAGLTGLEKKVICLNSHWLYGVNELKPISLGFVVPNSSGVIGLNLQHFGFESLKENSLNLAYSRKLTAKLNGGIQFNYTNSRVINYETSHIVGLSIGLNLLIINDLRLGIHIQNPFIFQKSETNNTPSVFRLGAAYSINKTVLLTTEIYKDLNYKPSFRFGTEYKPTSKLIITGGFQTRPNTISLGFGFWLSEKLRIELAVTSHSVLGITPALSIIDVLKK
jgi:hypothetical protein